MAVICLVDIRVFTVVEEGEEQDLQEELMLICVAMEYRILETMENQAQADC